MNFSEYRAEALKILWPRVLTDPHLKYSKRLVINSKGFSIWEVDDICAMNWKYGNPLSSCVDGLTSYIIVIMN